MSYGRNVPWQECPVAGASRGSRIPGSPVSLPLGGHARGDPVALGHPGSLPAVLLPVVEKQSLGEGGMKDTKTRGSLFFKKSFYFP